MTIYLDVLLDHNGIIKFVDFGAAKVAVRNKTVMKTVQGTRINSLTGTPMYMSPEVIKGEKTGRRGAMDIWSLGCVILEMATGRRPWQSDNEWAVMFQIGVATKHPPLPDPSQLSPAGIDFIRKCLEIDPGDRPSAEDLLEHEWLRALVADIGYENQKYEEEMALAAQAAVSLLCKQSLHCV